MPVETVVIVAIIVCAFAIFAGAVAWGQRNSSRTDGADSGVITASIAKGPVAATVPKPAPRKTERAETKSVA